MGDDGSATDGQDGSPTTADAIVAALEALGVERAFAYSGGRVIKPLERISGWRSLRRRLAPCSSQTENMDPVNPCR